MVPQFCVIQRLATASATTAASGTIVLLGFAHAQCATLELVAIEGLHCSGSIGSGHLHEAEATRSASVTIGNHFGGFDGSMLRKQGAQGVIRRVERKVAN